MNDKYKELFSYISDTDESCASDILYSLELVKTSLNTTLKRIKKEIQIATDNDSFDGISQIAGYCKQITDINTDIEQLITALHLDKAPAPIKQEKQETIIVPPSTGIVDYSAFDVNRTEPHTLDEDFENKKICGFNINDVHISANSWQDALVKLCAYLYKVDSRKMETFVDNPLFIGKKNSCFMRTSVPKRNKQIPGSNLYVWINNSANRIVFFIQRILSEYDIPTKDFTVYLRRDLSELHK